MKRIGLLCAGDEEFHPFLLHIHNFTTSQYAMLQFYEGWIEDIPVVALYSGVCKVNAAIAAQILIDRYDVGLIINAGTAGGMHPNIQLFDTVISTQVAYHDVADDILTEFHPWMPSVYFDVDKRMIDVAKTVSTRHPRVHLGRMVTGEQFIAENLRENIVERFDPLSVDMETGSIAHVCYVNRVLFIAIRSITDTADHQGMENFEVNCAKAAVIAKDMTLEFLRELANRHIL